MISTHYDALIVGGRPAGASLAARLGMQGLRVLLLERVSFPSLPAFSSPIIYSPSLKLLDEIGADEGHYARNTPRIRRVIAENSAFTTVVPLPDAHGRDYGYAIDRARFDAALWENAYHFPTVVGRQNFFVTDLLWENGRVIGVIGHEGKSGPAEQFTSDLVIGADGRFSLIARNANATERDVHTENPTSLYYSYWENVCPYDENGATAVAYEGGYGYGFLVMDSADNTTMVGFEGQADLLDPDPGHVADFYRDLVLSHPKIRARVKGAEMVTPVRGIRRVGNLYRQPGGAGWALVGDAYHQHDPLDGQGIYNALFGAKALAWAIRAFQRGEKSWDVALAEYDEAVRVKTYGMYRTTLLNVQTNLYNDMRLPGWALNGFRWAMEDPGMAWLIGQMLTRQLPPEMITLLTPSVMMSGVARGLIRDFGKRLTGG
jgi:flavin-dependent dehydrogenase